LTAETTRRAFSYLLLNDRVIVGRGQAELMAAVRRIGGVAARGKGQRIGLQMATGKVLQFDPSRGYGFVAADDGGEDVFLHASVFNGDPSELTPGTALEFEVMAGDRGRKAFAVRFAADSPAPQVKAVVPTQATAVIDDEQMCDVLSQGEFTTVLTEILLKTIPALTGPQILEVRQSLVGLAKQHGWIDV
jgi:cold shock protein